MEKAESANKGTILLATVKGDVHDIGKNLVEIILGNNGYRVINLGIKVPPEELVRAYREHQPDAIGLSGLLVKSAQMMVITAQDLQTAGIDCPILVGGAALTEQLHPPADRARVRGPRRLRHGRDDRPRPREPAHATRMRRAALVQQLEARDAQCSAASGTRAAAPTDGARVVTQAVLRQDLRGPAAARSQAPRAPRLRSRRDLPLHQSGDALHPPSRLQGQVHRGARRAATRRRASCAPRSPRSRRRCCAGPRSRPTRSTSSSAPQSDGDALLIYGPTAAIRSSASTSAGRRRTAVSRLADFTLPRDSGRADYVAMFATTVGPGVRALADEWKDARRLPALAHPAGAGARGRRGVRRAAAPEDPRDVGLRRSAGTHHAGSLQGAVPRHPGLVRLPGVPAPRGPSAALPPARRRAADRRAAHRGLHDGARGVGLGARLPPSGGAATSASPPRTPRGSSAVSASPAAPPPAPDPTPRRAAAARRKKKEPRGSLAAPCWVRSIER